MWYASVSFTTKALATAALGLPWTDITIMLHEAVFWVRYGCDMVMLRLLH